MARHQADYGLPAYDTQMITGQKALADFFEAAVALDPIPTQVSNWIMGQVMGQLSARGMEAKDMAFSPRLPGPAHRPGQDGRLNRNTAVKVFEAVFETDGDVDAYVKSTTWSRCPMRAWCRRRWRRSLPPIPRASRTIRPASRRPLASWWARSCANSRARPAPGGQRDHTSAAGDALNMLFPNAKYPRTKVRGIFFASICPAQCR